MKTNLKKTGLPIIIAATILIISGIGISITFTSCIKVKRCLEDDHPLSCKDSEGCCPIDKPYSDGEHCWADYASCASSGNSCELCEKE